ncbi:MAG: hypothetical protein EXR78_05445 [Deltaproteobacteria bacterium]|nr:hypothetical protein [Deltaproteobacteria bacterium]
MEKKSGITVTHEGLFIPARYFAGMADQLEVELAAREIRIRSSLAEKASHAEKSGNAKACQSQVARMERSGIGTPSALTVGRPGLRCASSRLLAYDRTL